MTFVFVLLYISSSLDARERWRSWRCRIWLATFSSRLGLSSTIYFLISTNSTNVRNKTNPQTFFAFVSFFVLFSPVGQSEETAGCLIYMFPLSPQFAFFHDLFFCGCCFVRRLLMFLCCSFVFHFVVHLVFFGEVTWSFSLFSFILRFWNQILICLSLRWRLWEISILRLLVRYLLETYSRSSSAVWWRV